MQSVFSSYQLLLGENEGAWGGERLKPESAPQCGVAGRTPGAGKTPAVGEAMGSEPQALGHRGMAKVTSREKESCRRLLGGEC